MEGGRNNQILGVTRSMDDATTHGVSAHTWKSCVLCSRMVLSHEQDARRVESGENWHALTTPTWPLKQATCCPPCTPHTLTVSSDEQVVTRLPHKVKELHQTGALWPIRVVSEDIWPASGGLLGGHVHAPSTLVLACNYVRRRCRLWCNTPLHVWRGSGLRIVMWGFFPSWSLSDLRCCSHVAAEATRNWEVTSHRS